MDAFENDRGAVEHLRSADPDLLITDIFMPEMEGIETIQRVRALKPHLPIIAISGFMFGSADYLEIAEKFGAIATLKKPFRPAELLELVSRLLAERALLSEAQGSPIRSAAMKADCGMSTLPNCRIRFLPSFCLSSSLRLRVMSPP